MALNRKDEAAVQVLNENRTKLGRCLQIFPFKSNFVEELFAEELITDSEQELILNGSTNLIRVVRMIDYLIPRLTPEVFAIFIDKLRPDGANLPDLRNELINLYAQKGGNRALFAGMPPPMEPSPMVKTVHCSDSIRGMTATSRRNKIYISFLLDDNKCSQVVWDSQRGHNMDLVNLKTTKPHSEETAVALFAKSRTTFAFVWPEKILWAELDFETGRVKEKESFARNTVFSSALCAAIHNVIVVGDISGSLHIFREREKIQTNVLPPDTIGLAGRASNQLLAWTKIGRVERFKMTDDSFTSDGSWTVPMSRSAEFVTCAEDDNFLAACFSWNRHLWFIFFSDNRWTTSVDLGPEPSRKEFVQLALEYEYCVVATPSKIFLFQKQTMLKCFRSPWMNTGIDLLRVVVFEDRDQFIVIAADGVKADILSISNNNN